MARGWLAIVMLSACYRPASNHESCAIACTTSCPPGYTCELGRCRANDNDTACPPLDAPGGGEFVVDAPPDAGPNACPETYDQTLAVATTKYRVVKQLGSWAAAAADCADDLAGEPFHTHLAVLTTDLEVSGVSALGGNAASWIGLTDRKTQGTFLWVTTESTSYPSASGSPWATNEPNMGADLDCVEMTLAQLATRLCTFTRQYYCECDLLPNDPTRY